MRDKPLDPRLRQAAAQLQIRLVGQSREEVEAALAQLQTVASLQVVRWPRRGRKDEWLVYASLELPASSSYRGDRSLPQPAAEEAAHLAQQEANTVQENQSEEKRAQQQANLQRRKPAAYGAGGSVREGEQVSHLHHERKQHHNEQAASANPQTNAPPLKSPLAMPPSGEEPC